MLVDLLFCLLITMKISLCHALLTLSQTSCDNSLAVLSVWGLCVRHKHWFAGLCQVPIPQVYPREISLALGTLPLTQKIGQTFPQLVYFWFMNSFWKHYFRYGIHTGHGPHGCWWCLGHQLSPSDWWLRKSYNTGHVACLKVICIQQ